MLNTVHVTAAAAIVMVVPEPALALPLCLASHIVLDTVPHWNWKPSGTALRNVGSVADLAGAVILSLLYTSRFEPSWVMLGGCFLSTVPDLIQGPYYFWNFKPGWLQAFIKWESTRQKWPWMPIWFGLATQVAVAVVSLVIIFR